MAEVLQILEDCAVHPTRRADRSPSAESEHSSAPPNLKNREQDLEDDEGDHVPFDAERAAVLQEVEPLTLERRPAL
jgi:hypothetical protein